MSSAQFCPFCSSLNVLTHWGRVTHICIGKLIIIGSDNGLSPDRRQAIIWANARLLSIGPWEHISMKISSKYSNFHWRKCTSKCRLRNGVHLVPASMCWCKQSCDRSDGIGNKCTWHINGLLAWCLFSAYCVLNPMTFYLKSFCI